MRDVAECKNGTGVLRKDDGRLPGILDGKRRGDVKSEFETRTVCLEVFVVGKTQSRDRTATDLAIENFNTAT